MLYAGAARLVALGIFVAVLTACGGGGGSGGGGGGGLTSYPDVALPDVSTATQKTLTPDNAKPALILAFNTISAVEDGIIPVPAAVDFFADSFSSSNSLAKVSRKLRELRPAQRTVDVSGDICVSGSATVEAGDNLIGKMVQRYRSCDLGGATLDGDIELDIREYYTSDTLTDVTYTYRGLRITSGQSDTVFDGTVVMTTGYPGAGFIEADLDVRDIKALQGIRIVDYRADFDIDYNNDNYGNYVYFVRQLRGRVYDDTGEYFDLGLTPGHAPWPMLLGENSSLMLSPSDMAAPYQVRFALDTTGDNIAEYWMFAALDAISTNDIANNNAPEFHFDTSTIRLDKGAQREVWFGNVTDADQQFVSVEWALVEQPDGTDPIVDASADGFVFSSNVAGDYRVQVTASDGERTTAQDVNIRVMYDMPQVSANAPVSVRLGETIHFNIDVLNPEEGNAEIIPVAMPGLRYDGTGAVTYVSVVPDFGVDQRVNLSFIVRNEDRENLAIFPVLVQSREILHPPLLLAAQINGEKFIGNFDLDVGYEEAREEGGASYSGSPVAIFDQDGSEYRYRQSYDFDSLLGATSSSLLGTSDFNADGVDEIIFFTKNAQGNNYVAYFDTINEKVGKIVYVDSNTESLFSSFKEYPALSRANIDAVGGDEYVLFVRTGFVVFDSDMNLLWKTSAVEYGYYGYRFAIANIDDDPALEIATEKGFVLDGGSHEWQRRLDFDASGQFFFSSDIGGNGQKELIYSDGVSLHRVTQGGNSVISDSSTFNVSGLESNALTANVDADPAQELVWMSHSGQSDSLIYLDYVNGVFEPKVLREVVQSYYGDSYQLEFVEGKIVGSSTFFSQWSNGSSSFAYDPVDGLLVLRGAMTDIALGDQHLRRGYIRGGTAIAEDNRELIFCGVTNVRGYNLFSYDVGAHYLDPDKYSMTPDVAGYSGGYWEDSVCYASSFGGAGDKFIVSGHVVTQDSWGGQVLFTKVQTVNGGNQIFRMDIPLSGSGLPLLKDGDLDGDSVSELVVAQGSVIRVYDVFGQRLLGEMSLRPDEVIRHMDLSRPASVRGKAKIAVATDDRILTLEYSEPGGLAILAEVQRPGMGWFGAQIAFSGESLLVGGLESPDPFSDQVYRVNLYDLNLNLVGNWVTPDQIRIMKSTYLPDGASFIVSVNGYPGTMKWRDPASGQILYTSPDSIYGVTLRNIFDFQLLTDEATQHMRAVIIDAEASFGEMADRIVITQ